MPGTHDKLGSAGRAVVYTEPVEASPVGHRDSMRELAEAMEAGAVSLLTILGGNPVFTAPADLRFEACLAKVPLRIHLGQYQDETSALCQWHVPQAHEPES